MNCSVNSDSFGDSKELLACNALTFVPGGSSDN